MAKFLFTGWPYPGCLHPQMAVARALAERGHAIGFYNGSSARVLIEGQSFRHFAFGHDLDEHISWLVASPSGLGRRMRWPWEMLPLLRAWCLETIPQQIRDLQAVFEAWQPDVIVCERPMWGPYLILRETHHVPVALLDSAACLLPGPDIAYPGLHLEPPRTWYSRLRAKAGAAVVEFVVRGMRRTASELRLRYGLPPLPSSLLALSAELPLTLVPSCPEFDYERHDLPPSVHYVGPCEWYPPPEEPEDWLAALPRDKPWVHVSEGTIYAQDPVLLRATIQALADLPVQLLVTTGKHRDPARLNLGPLPPNVVVKAWITHGVLLPLLDVMVTHGGGGTIVASLSAGVPMVVVPLMWDQPENAQRVVAASAGVMLSQARCTPRWMRAAVERVLADPAYRHNARRLAGHMQRYGGPPQAAALLEQLIPAQAPRDT